MLPGQSQSFITVSPSAFETTPAKQDKQDRQDRKRAQNRAAQRAYPLTNTGKNQKQRILALEAAVAQAGLISPQSPAHADAVSVDIGDDDSIGRNGNLHRSLHQEQQPDLTWSNDQPWSDISWPGQTSTETITVTRQSPLHLAASKGSENIIRILLDSGADVTKQGSQGNTPLHKAAEAGSASVVNLLLSRSADPNQPNNLGQTPLFFAVKVGCHKTVDELLDHDVDVNKQDLAGNTALSWAVEGDLDYLVVTLITCGADVNL